MKERKLYICEHCGAEYRDSKNAKECEEHHKLPTEIKASRFRMAAEYPEKIEVKFSDGSTHWYQRQETLIMSKPLLECKYCGKEL